MPGDTPFWALDARDALHEAGATADGLTSAEAAARLARYGHNVIGGGKRRGPVRQLLAQFTSPIVLILIAAAILSLFLGDRPDALIILAIVAASGLLSFWQEYGASNAVERLLALVAVRTQVLRDGVEVALPTDVVVPGDVIRLRAGATVPADCLVLASTALFVDESALTGESYPAEKQAGVVEADSPIAKRANSTFMGTHVVSGTADVLVMRTGASTEFGSVSEHLETAPAETEFERGVRRFGYLLMEVTLLLVIAIFAFNVLLRRPVVDSFLFSLALAVGLTPQLLPAIISINLAHGARLMAKRHVIVKRLDSIEDFGSMDVLCSDKTGTLTSGTVVVAGAYDVAGDDDEDVMRYAYTNSLFETGFSDPIDDAIRTARTFDVSAVTKLDEEPYDFLRKRLSILVERDGHPLMITKGALAKILDVCSEARRPDGSIVPLADVRADIERMYERLSASGRRTLGVAIRTDLDVRAIDPTFERGMTFVGVVAFEDPAKPGATEAIAELARLGVSLKIITGDNALVARTLGCHMGLDEPVIMTGREVHETKTSALISRAGNVDVFAEIEPNQKERIILALRKAGHVVGYIGDGINDASALHAADVGISVNSAVDVAKEAADLVLLEPGLDVLAQGVAGGRATFANTLKYVFMATSANFGNMFSMAGASLFLPFLPLLPTQILLTNLMTDLPEATIARDRVDPELTERPRRWDVRFIRDFMLVFGLLSSVFDYATFAALLLILHAGPAEFRTGWFVESVLSASMIVLVIRTRRPMWRSRPGWALAAATGAVWVLTLAIPYTPLGTLFRFVPLPPVFLAMLAVILVLYVSGAEAAKALFYRYRS